MSRLKVGILAGVMGLLIGIVVGPRAHVAFWTLVLDACPSQNAKLRASQRLGESEAGRGALFARTTSSDKSVRTWSIAEIMWTEHPWYTCFLLDRLPDSYVDERIDVVRGLDYSAMHRRVLQVLTYELSHATNPEVRKESRKVLDSFRLVEVKEQGARNKRPSGLRRTL